MNRSNSRRRRAKQRRADNVALEQLVREARSHVRRLDTRGSVFDVLVDASADEQAETIASVINDVVQSELLDPLAVRSVRARKP